MDFAPVIIRFGHLNIFAGYSPDSCPLAKKS